MLIKFSKQIGESLAKIINTKVFISKSIWMSKVKDNLLRKTKKKEPAELLK